VLAGEFVSPGSFSLRTLNFLKSLSRAEAEKISRLLSFVVNQECVIKTPYFESRFAFHELLELEEIGVIIGVQGRPLLYEYSDLQIGRETYDFVHHDVAIRIIIDKDKSKNHIRNVLKLTTIGKELLSIHDCEFNREYFDSLLEVMKTKYKHIFTAENVNWIGADEFSSDNFVKAPD
jgi:hypothetical protein